MAGAEGQHFHISWPRFLEDDLKALARLAAQQGKHQEFIQNLKAVVHLLETCPLEWGDPERHTSLPDGTVYHGLREALMVRYTVHEPQRVVFMYEIGLVPGSYLSQEEET